MRVIAFLSLFFGFIGIMLLDGQTFTHAVLGIIFGCAAIGCGWASSRKDCADIGRRWLGRSTAILGLGLALFCIFDLPAKYRFQEKFNTRSKELHGRNRANPVGDFHALGFDDASEAKILFDTYKQVFLVHVSEDYFEDSLHHFNGFVTKSDKGDWKPGEKVSFEYFTDSPAPTASNTFAGSDMLLLADVHAGTEIIFGGAGDFFLVDSNVQQVLYLVFPDGEQ